MKWMGSSWSGEGHCEVDGVIVEWRGSSTVEGRVIAEEGGTI